MENRKKYLSLDDILADDDFNLIEEPIKAITSTPITADERLVTSFQNILDFYEKNLREPQNTGEMQERLLASRLKSIRENTEKITQLRKYDRFGILDIQEEELPEINSLDDILSLDNFGLIEEDTLGIFDLKHVSLPDKSRAESDFVARRKPCLDFNKFEPLFVQVQKDLREGKRKMVDFSQRNLQEGAFYVHNGVIFYLEKINITTKEHYKPDGTRVREDGRTRCIFENGTESNMLKRSVEKILYENGKVITENVDDTANFFNEHDMFSGYIYVLKSMSKKPEVASISDLYKIGFTSDSVENRIKNAKNDPTFLMDEVQIVRTYKCANFNSQKLEQLVHKFLGEVCLDLNIFDSNGISYSPREWFVAPIEVIEEAISLIINNSILEYQYDFKMRKIVKR